MTESKESSKWYVEVWYKDGVTDAVGESVKKGVADLGIPHPESVRTAQKYLIQGSLSKSDIEKICARLLANPVVQDFRISPE